LKVTVYGAASNRIDEKYIKDGFELGKKLGERGHSMVFGSGSEGLMGAVARGFKSVGAYVHGVIPKFFEDENVEELFLDCDQLIEPDTMRERKQIMEDNADAFIIVPGGIGTFEEFFEILTLKQLCRHNKPIAIYNIKGYYNELLYAIEQATQKHFIRGGCMDLFHISDDEKDLFAYIENPMQEQKTIRELKDG
jgi:uncharacterized protein (TIGR00730 family)